jgi:hypothetical protein
VKIFTEAHKSRRKRGESLESIPSSSITNNRKYSIPGLSQTESGELEEKKSLK